MDSTGHLQESRFPEDCGSSPWGLRTVERRELAPAQHSLIQDCSSHAILSRRVPEAGSATYLLWSRYGISQVSVFLSGKCVC